MCETKDTNQKNIDRVLDLLIMLSKQPSPMSVADISKGLGVTRSTAYAMLASTQEKSFVERDENGKFFLGYRLLELASTYYHHYPFLYVAEKHVADLANKWNLDAMVYIYKSPCVCLKLLATTPLSGMPLKPTFGGAIPAHATAQGKLLMSALPEDVLEKDLELTELEQYTPATITSKEELKAILREMRGADYAIEMGERFAHRGAIASAIRDRGGNVIAAICVPLDNEFFEENRQRLIEDITLAGAHISSELGYANAII